LDLQRGKVEEGKNKERGERERERKGENERGGERAIKGKGQGGRKKEIVPPHGDGCRKVGAYIDGWFCRRPVRYAASASVAI